MDKAVILFTVLFLTGCQTTNTERSIFTTRETRYTSIQGEGELTKEMQEKMNQFGGKPFQNFAAGNFKNELRIDSVFGGRTYNYTVPMPELKEGESRAVTLADPRSLTFSVQDAVGKAGQWLAENFPAIRDWDLNSVTFENNDVLPYYEIDVSTPAINGGMLLIFKLDGTLLEPEWPEGKPAF